MDSEDEVDVDGEDITDMFADLEGLHAGLVPFFVPLREANRLQQLHAYADEEQEGDQDADTDDDIFDDKAETQVRRELVEEIRQCDAEIATLETALKIVKGLANGIDKAMGALDFEELDGEQLRLALEKFKKHYPHYGANYHAIWKGYDSCQGGFDLTQNYVCEAIREAWRMIFTNSGREAPPYGVLRKAAKEVEERLCESCETAPTWVRWEMVEFCGTPDGVGRCME